MATDYGSDPVDPEYTYQEHLASRDTIYRRVMEIRAGAQLHNTPQMWLDLLATTPTASSPAIRPRHPLPSSRTSQ